MWDILADEVALGQVSLPNTSVLPISLSFHHYSIHIHSCITDAVLDTDINPLNPELNPICYLLALLRAHHFFHVSRIRVKLLTFRLLMSYIYIWSTYS